METITIPKNEYIELIKIKQMFNIIKENNILSDFKNDFEKECFECENSNIEEAKSKEPYTKLFGIWKDEKFSAKEYRLKLWQRKNIF